MLQYLTLENGSRKDLVAALLKALSPIRIHQSSYIETEQEARAVTNPQAEPTPSTRATHSMRGAGRILDVDVDDVCRECGANTQTSAVKTRPCSFCRNQVLQDALFCQHCGKKISKKEEAPRGGETLPMSGETQLKVEAAQADAEAETQRQVEAASLAVAAAPSAVACPPPLQVPPPQLIVWFRPQSARSVSPPAGHTPQNHTSNVDDHDNTSLGKKGPSSMQTDTCRHELAISCADHATRQEVEPAARKADVRQQPTQTSPTQHCSTSRTRPPSSWREMEKRWETGGLGTYMYGRK